MGILCSHPQVWLLLAAVRNAGMAVEPCVQEASFPEVDLLCSSLIHKFIIPSGAVLWIRIAAFYSVQVCSDFEIHVLLVLV